MEYDDLFPNEDETLMELVNNSFNNNEDIDETPIDFEYSKHERRRIKLENIDYNNKIGYIMRRPLNNITNSKLKNKLQYIQFYKTSFFPGSNIKNAITGNFYEYLVGSKNEKLLFKIAICTGEKGTLNYIDNKFIAEPSSLFYDSPEQCEKHLCIEIHQKTKTKWLESKNKYIHNLK